MSYFEIDKTTPRVERAPDAEAIRRLGEDLAATAREKRRSRSLQSCHRPALRPPVPAYRGPSHAFVPQCSARLLNDPRLSDGARRCGAKLMELAYRRDRAGRSFQGTVSYLAKALGRSERAVQTYLAQLRAGGYVRHEVIRSERARMCVGILITLLGPLFPRHHSIEWPLHVRSTGRSGVKRDSENYTPNSRKRDSGSRITVEHWTLRCMEGVFRSFMKTIPAYGSLA